jgi:hypothetical protein
MHPLIIKFIEITLNKTMFCVTNDKANYHFKTVFRFLNCFTWTLIKQKQ